MVTSSSAGKMLGRDDTSTAEWASGDLHACLRPVPGESDLWCLTVIRPAAPGLLAPWRAAMMRVESLRPR